MRRKGRIGATAFFVRLACAMALVFVAFAHPPAEASPVADVDLAAYVLPDGTMPDLCVTMAGEEGDAARLVTPCEFCRIASATVLPVPADAPLAAVSRDAGPLAATDAAPPAPARALLPSAPPQGPPSLSA